MDRRTRPIFQEHENPLKTNKIPNIQEVTQKIAIHEKRKKKENIISGNSGAIKSIFVSHPKYII
jgi:hypothetical protein